MSVRINTQGFRTFRTNIERDLARLVRIYTQKIQASAKRYAPVRTGRLRAAIQHTLRDLVGTIFSGVDYGIWLEIGTRKMAAQPYLLPALREHGPAFFRAVRKLVEGK